MKIARREFLRQQGSLWVLSCLPLASCRKPKTRSDLLSSLVLDVVVPDVRAVVAITEQLDQSVAAFVAGPSLAGLRRAREACRSALVAWKRAHCFRSGPMVETNALLRATFWPVRATAIEAALASAAPMDEALVEALGADAKGLYALEVLLFPLELDDERALAQLSGPAAERRRLLVAALARNVANHAHNAGRALGDGTAYAKRFAAGGQDSVSRLVSQMTSTVETLAVNRLDLVLGLSQSRLLKPTDVEGWPSGTSQQLALAELTGIERLSTGGDGGAGTGVAELVRLVAPAVEQRLRQRLGDAIAAVRKLSAPLERVVVAQRPLLVSALAATKALELALKVDVASALGVTLTFQTGDGD